MSNAPLNAAQLLGLLPTTLRDELVEAYSEVLRNYRESRWEPSELNAGKLCEVVYTILRGHVDGAFPARASKPKNMVDACRALEQVDDTKYPRSVRIQIPRMLIAMYEIRNNRGVGHVGGDVNANHMDATCTLHMSQWVVAELVRLFHNINPTEAAQAIDTLVERTIPAVWNVDGRLRILDTSLNMREKTLLLLYQTQKPVQEKDLVEWVEYSNASVYRRDVLRKLHVEKLVEFSEADRKITISPKGVAEAERILAR